MRIVNKHKIVCLIILTIFFFNSLYADVKTISVKNVGDIDVITTLNVSQVGDILFVSASELAEKLHWKIELNKELKQALLYPEGKIVKISGENPFVMMDNKVYQLPVEVKYIGGELFIPLNHFINNLNNVISNKYLFDKKENLLEINPNKYNLHGIAIEKKKNGILVRVGSSSKFKNISSWSLPSGWFYIQIYGGKIDTVDEMNYPPLEKSDDVKKIIINQMEELAQISIKLNEKVEEHIITQDEKAGEIQISLVKKLINNNKPDVKIENILKEQKKNWEINTIVLDAGHGGQDPGTRGISGTLEKDVALDITKRLGALIEKNLNIDVQYIRTTDKFVPLEERTKVANNVKGKLFISIHGNSTDRRTTNVRGVEIFFLSPAKDETSIEVAKRENKVVEMYENVERYQNILKGDNILFTIMQSGFIRESEEMAVILLNSISKKVRTVKRGVKQGGFIVLIGASMPSVLVEVGFLNNRMDENNLRQKAYRQLIAEGIFEGIKDFIKSSRREIAKVNK